MTTTNTPGSVQRSDNPNIPDTGAPRLNLSGRHPLWGWVAGRAASAEAGREFDKLATDLTTPRDSLTREVNLVVSLSRTAPRLLRLPAGAICYAVATGFAIRIPVSRPVALSTSLC